MPILTNLQSRYQKILSKSRAVPARLTCRQLTYVVDSELVHLYNLMPSRSDLQSKFCLIPIGGYGRMELAPHSDIDILYLHENLSEENLQFIISYFNNYLYNSGKEVGYACRTLEECKVYLNDLHSFYAILDSRFLLGSESLYAKYHIEVLSSLPSELVQEYKESKMSALESNLLSPLHISEPNIKNGPFGLRDIQTIYWMEKSERELPSLAGLAVLPVFSRGEAQLIDQAYDFYLRVRSALHVLSGRKVDTLTIPIQPQVAEYLGFGSQNELNSIDSFMRILYGHESEVHSFIATYLDYKKIEGKRGFIPYEKGNLYFEILGKTLYPNHLKNLFNDPDTLYSDILIVFKICAEQNLEPSSILLNEIKFASNFLEENFMNSQTAIQIFLDILKKGKNVGKILTFMHHSKILGKLIPEFGACTNFPLFSYHHHYSVDEHTLLILRELDRLIEGTFEIKDVQEVFRECQDVHILMLAIILHDVGKVKDGDHCQYGAELSLGVGERLGLSDEEIDLLRFLVDQHILMAELSTKRDTNDPSIISDFIIEVGDVNRLRLLYVMTIIDTKSVGRATLTNWKRAILRTLYDNAIEALERGIQTRSEPQRLKRELIEKENLDPKLAEIIIQYAIGFEPDTYINYFTARRIFHHFMIFLERKAEIEISPIIEVEQEPAYITFTVYHKTDRFFLSDLTGAVASMGLNLIGLRSFSHDKKQMIQCVQITDNKGGGEIPVEKLDKLKENLVLLFQKKLNVTDLLQSPGEWLSFNKIPGVMVEEKIEFNNLLAEDFTVLEVRLPDSLGLLHRIIKSILSFDVQLYFVRVSTSADYAYDSFYLTDLKGEKLFDSKLMHSIRESIAHASKEKIQSPYSIIQF